MSAYLQGGPDNKNHAMFPQAIFNVNYPTAGTFAIRVDEMTPDGAKLQATLDGHRVAAVDFGAPAPAFGGPNRPARRGNPRLNTSLEIPIPAGPHVLKLENTGSDWIHIRDFTLSPYTSQLAVLAKGDSDFAVLWIYKRDKTSSEPISGKLTVPGIAAGNYHVVWWDTYKSQIIKDESAAATADGLTLTTPPVDQDIAVWINRGGS
jgi:hypothetical protein